jgi:hypothetical protein
VVTADVGEARLHSDGRVRTRQALRKHQLSAALLFDPLDIRYPRESIRVGHNGVPHSHDTERCQ